MRLGAERLVVFDHGQPKHYVELAAVAAVRQGLNRTILLMRDGMKVPISHSSFLKSEDAQTFRQALAERLAKTAWPAPRNHSLPRFPARAIEGASEPARSVTP